MRKKVLVLNTGITGTQAYDFYLVPNEITAEELEDLATTRALENAESYGIYPMPDDEDADEDEDEEGNYYSEGISGHWEDYNPSKHDRHACGKIEWCSF